MSRNWSKEMEPHHGDGTRERGDTWRASYEDDDGTVFRITGNGVYNYPHIIVKSSTGESWTFDLFKAVDQREHIAADKQRFRAFMVAVNAWGGELEWRTKADQNETKQFRL